ncbi:hypothetical protein TNCV_2050511 [Trichonephila clavipes]|nr:hypothetical protein TNCV_2050511 [Trichonephila clavipes]
MHMKCPPGKDSWCFYRRALAKGEKPAPHKLNIGTPINPDYLTKIVPIYQRLASDSLLKGCVTDEHLDFMKESLGYAATPTAKDAMNDTALEAKSITKCFKMSVEECGISVDGKDTWAFIAKCGFYRNFIH